MAVDPHHVRDPLYRYDTHFPDRLSRMYITPECPMAVNRRTKAMKSRSGIRYRTQPITFDEIKEVDEEVVENPGEDLEGMKHSFTAFSKSMDGLVVDKLGSSLAAASSPEDTSLASTSDEGQSLGAACEPGLPLNLARGRPRKKNAKQKVVPD